MKPTTLDLLIGRSKIRANRARGSMPRAKRRALAPKEPRAAIVLYMQRLSRMVGRMAEVTESVLFDERDPLDPGRIEEAIRRVRTDAPARVTSAQWGALELAITEIAEDAEIDARAAALAVLKHSRKEMSRVLGIDIRDDRALEPYVRKFIDENVSLIRSVAVDQILRMRDIIDTSTAAQVSTRDLSKALRLSFDFAKSRADLIARDQTLKANADLSQLRQQQVGVTEYIWTTSGDERVREGHAALDGTRQSWLRPPVVDPKTGRREHPGRDFQCRCTATPIIDQLLGAP